MEEREGGGVGGELEVYRRAVALKRSGPTYAQVADALSAEGFAPLRGRIGRPPREEPAERLVVYLPIPLKRRLEHLAVDERRSLTALVADAVQAYLRRKPSR